MKIFTIIGIVFLVLGAWAAFQTFQPHSVEDVGADANSILAITFLPIGIIFTLVGIYVTRLGDARGEREGDGGPRNKYKSTQTRNYVNERPMIRLELSVNLPVARRIRWSTVRSSPSSHWG